MCPTAFEYLKERGEIEASTVQYRLAIDLKNDLASAWLHLGISLGQLDRIDEAMDAYQVNSNLQGSSHRPRDKIHKRCLLYQHS